MKYIKTYEGSDSEEWKIGDVVVALKNMYAGHTYWIIEGEKYIITDFNFDKMHLCSYDGKIQYFFSQDMDDFISLTEWKANKYNL